MIFQLRDSFGNTLSKPRFISEVTSLWDGDAVSYKNPPVTAGSTLPTYRGQTYPYLERAAFTVFDSYFTVVCPD